MKKVQRMIILGLSKVQNQKNNSFVLLPLIAIALIPELAIAQDPISEFNDSLATSSSGLNTTALLIVRICKYVAFFASVIGLVSFIATRSGDNDVAGKVGKWCIGILAFSVGLGVAVKVFGISGAV